MKIVADKYIPFVREAFSQLGEVQLVEPASLTPAVLKDADMLLVRSVAKVDRSLLAGSRVHFVGTATSGVDHVDTEYLRKAGIAFAHAAGCNARSVAEYVIASLLYLYTRHQYDFNAKSIGVVGVGHVGRLVADMARALGLKVLQCDPPKARSQSSSEYQPLEDLLECDILTLHVPLSRTGPDATYHLFDSSKYDVIKQGCVFINTSRGAVVKTEALLKAVASGKIGHAILDVWENEPDPEYKLVRQAALATPHIAGYSFDGKVRATELLFEQAVNDAGLSMQWQPPMPELDRQQICLRAEERSFHAILNDVVEHCYRIDEDDAQMRTMSKFPAIQRGMEFSRLRDDYRVRREFGNYEILNCHNKELRLSLRTFGFGKKVE